MRHFFFSILILTCLCACSPTKPGENGILADNNIVEGEPMPLLGGKSHLPYARIYKTNGDYNDNVAAQFDNISGTFISYPAPSDVGKFSTPLILVDGWLLDRRGGVAYNTVFLKWTYSEYSRLNEVPTLAELKESILTKAKVIEVREIPMTINKAMQDTSAVNAYIKKIY